jgi:glycosyltransferase involved in cell wall biosynthesis
MKLLIFSGLKDKKLISKISPILSLEKIEKVYLIRNTPLKYKKVRSLNPPFYLIFLSELIKFLCGLYVCLFKKIDYIIGIFLRPHGIFAYILGKVFRKPVIQLFVGNDVDFIEKHKRLFKNLLKSSKHIGVRGTRSKKRLCDIVKKENKFFIHYNVYSPPAVNQDISGDEKILDIVCVADFTKVKRMDVFLKVISRMKQKYPGIKASMAGGNGRKHRYEKMKHRMNLDENVAFEGIVTDVYSYLMKGRLFMMTSEAEGLPMSLIESMSVGLPCVVPDVGDIPDIAEDGKNALVVPPLDVEAFASRAIQLLEDKILYEKISRNALDAIRKKETQFSLQYNKEIWDNILG